MTEQPQFDVFLSYNRQDQPDVIKIADKLKKCGLNVWQDVEQILPGDFFMPVIEQAILKARSTAIFIGANGIGSFQDVEIQTSYIESLKKKTFL